MRKLIRETVQWENITDGRLEMEQFSYELGQGVMHKETGVLVIPMTLNFVLPYDELLKIKAIVKSKLDFIDDVKFRFKYDNVILTEEEIIKNYLPYLIQILESNGSGFATALNGKFFALDKETEILTFHCFGKTSEEQLNQQISPQFERILMKNFGLKLKVRFENDEEFYQEKAEDIKQDLKEEMVKTLEENRQKAQMAETAPKKDNGFDDNFGAKSDNGFKGGRPWKSRKEAKIKDNFVMGKGFTGEADHQLSNLEPSMGTVIVEGVLYKMESKVIRSGNHIASILITDERTTICCKSFVSEEKWNEMSEFLKPGDRLKVLGEVQFDTFENLNVVMFKEIEKLSRSMDREDTSEIGKRVELHLHTKMSQMDGLNEPKDAVRQAALWGQPAIAITDHGVVQSFPDAAGEAAAQAKAGRPIKIIYGVEGYSFDDSDCIMEDGSIDYKKKPVNHIIILAKSQEGLKNIYKLVSISHIDYFYRKPRLPWSVINAHREGLIIGSACCYGEVFQSLVTHVYEERRTHLQKRVEALSHEEQERIASRYDYLEIQPVINNRFMIEDEYYFEGKRVETEEDVRNVNRRIVEIADKLGKPVVATCDAHYDKPESAIYRNILMAGMGFEDAENGEGLYMRTTDEMMEEFSYLGDRAKEIVIDNTNLIADMVDGSILPVPNGKFPPKIPGAEDTLRRTCEERLRETYGDDPDPAIIERFKKELNSIIDNGYAVMYVSAQMLVQKSLSDGYLVGSRGSVGSSFAATMAGITEVNPLDPHYLCPNCKHMEWGDKNTYDCGIDMPPKKCPVCGADMKRDGFTIPFATFLGFNGDKEPDIDLNFAGEYQPVAHRYVGEIFGEKNVFKAGTVGTVADKTAFGYVMKFFEERGIPVNKYEADRLTSHCTGVKRTTGQHPGGIVICPDDHEIFEFCPIQHPANDASSGVITTHFDYHKIDTNLLKLDILGHDVPSMIRQLQDMTGVDPLKVDLTDRKVLSIFNGIEALDIKDKEYKFKHGSYAIPEFGTPFVRQMLDDTQPDKFADLVRISGFSHGTDVWLNNAQEYIRTKQATMREVISTRDDIMNYLILKGVENGHAFKIMEIVRKGKKDLSEEQVAEMKEHGVPDWYIDSCNKIKYMFPRAHAVAYTMMSFRMAWYKVYYPQEFYATYFTTKVDDFDDQTILKGKDAILQQMDLIDMKGNNATPKEKSQYTVLEVAYEMYARGYEFMAPRLDKSKALKFWVEDGKVLLPFVALDGVGASAAQSFYDAYHEKPFDTVEEVMKRTKLNKTSIQALRDYGVFDGLPETDQLSMF
ncbi:MAG: PolC-type DNA polymerase III [Firmicutes bacterium]|nr:PolC-type DNA polymerase III [Bacillota bacterium]